MNDRSRTYTVPVVGTPVTVTVWLVPCDSEYTLLAPSDVPTHRKYCVTPAPLVQVNVTVEDVRIDPGGGSTISATAGP